MAMPNPWPRRLAIPLAAIGAAEVGHLFTYAVRFGPGAFAIQSGGAHAYLPSLAALVSGSLGAGVMIALLLIALARQCDSRQRSGARAPLINLASLLLVLQLAIFGIQEAGEALAMHSALPAGADLAFWGVLGQLPAALATSLIVRRLLAEVETAVEVLSEGATVRLSVGRFTSPPISVPGYRPLLHARSRVRSNPLRGPPLSA
jgi:hypothetical protein